VPRTRSDLTHYEWAAALLLNVLLPRSDRAFLARLDNGLPFETCPGDNLKTLEIVERAYENG